MQHDIEIFSPLTRRYIDPDSLPTAKPRKTPAKTKSATRRAKEEKKTTRKRSIPIVFFDTETTTDPMQVARIVQFVVRDVDGCRFDGIAINDKLLEDSEISTIRAYCYEQNLRFVPSIGSFVQDVLYEYGFNQNGRIVGFNLPFDLAAISAAQGRVPVDFVADNTAIKNKDDVQDVGQAKPYDPFKRSRKDFFKQDGFSLMLCDCGTRGYVCTKHPRALIRKLGPQKYAFRWSAACYVEKGKEPVIRKSHGHFLDLRVIGKAIRVISKKSLKDMCSNYSNKMPLARLSELWGTYLKEYEYDLLNDANTHLSDKERDRMLARQRNGITATGDYPFKAIKTAHGGAIDFLYLDYAMLDVYESELLHDAIVSEYLVHDLPVPIQNIYSEASLAKAYYTKLGIKPFLKAHPDFPKDVIGYAMQSFYAGRTECRYRKSLCEVVYCDFKSAYPTVNSLLGLQDFILAERIEVVRGERARASVEQLLTEFSIQGVNWLRNRANWRRLHYLVKVYPNGALLPLRTDFNGDGVPNVGMAYCHPTADMKSGMWFTIQHLLQGMLLGGRSYEILDVVELVPHGRYPTKPITLLDGSEINLATDDFFTSIIDLRDVMKGKMNSAKTQAERDAYNSVQGTLKLLANSGSYGILVEFIADKLPEPIKATSYADCEYDIAADVIDKPGKWFLGPLGSFITSASWLLLAIGETLAGSHGIRIAYCDTDSLLFRKPDNMERETFYRAIDSVRDWFKDLTPYHKVSDGLLKLEDHNFKVRDHSKLPDGKTDDGLPNIHGGEHEPLYFYGISSKRYVALNIIERDGVQVPYVRTSSEHGLGAYRVVEGAEKRWAERLASKPELQNVAFNHWWRDMLYLEFLLAYLNGREFTRSNIPELDTPAFAQITITGWHLYYTYRNCGIRPFSFFTTVPAGWQIDNSNRNNPQDINEHKKKGLYTGSRDEFEDLSAIKWLSLHDNKQIYPANLAWLGELLAGYFDHTDTKWRDSDGVGQMEYKTVLLSAPRHCGKDTNARTDLDDIGDDYNEENGDVETLPYQTSGLIDEYTISEIEWLTECKNERKALHHNVSESDLIHLGFPTTGDLQRWVHTVGVGETAKELGIDRKTLMRWINKFDNAKPDARMALYSRYRKWKERRDIPYDIARKMRVDWKTMIRGDLDSEQARERVAAIAKALDCTLSKIQRIADARELPSLELGRKILGWLDGNDETFSLVA